MLMIKSLVKSLPHPLLLRIHHHYDLHRQASMAREASKFTRLPLLQTLDLPSVKTSDTVFILGSGSSINEIPESKWKVIGSHDTIAMNFWPVHKFVPSIYLFENVRLDEGCDSMFYALRDLLERRACDYRNTVKIVSELAPLNRRQITLQIPDGFRPHLYIGYSANVVARDEKELVAGLRYLLGKGVFEQRSRICWQFKCAGSVLAAMSMAVCMGYRRIVLCGIDLRNAEYFYQDPERYPDACKWEFVPRNTSHLAARRLHWLVPAQEVIVHFKKEVLDPAQIELFVENRSSALFPRIPELPSETLQQYARKAIGEALPQS
jgi:hypothetical protein